MQTANEIVRYLNMQFENYKDMYDIFGPVGAERRRSIDSINDNEELKQTINQHLVSIVEGTYEKISRKVSESSNNEEKSRGSRLNNSINIREMINHRRVVS